MGGSGPIPNPKDTVENALNQAVCSGQMTLRAAQREIARNWIKAAAALGINIPSPQPPPATGSGAHCTATASYSAYYGDVDAGWRRALGWSWCPRARSSSRSETKVYRPLPWCIRFVRGVAEPAVAAALRTFK